jgi:hypothetical protein
VNTGNLVAWRPFLWSGDQSRTSVTTGFTVMSARTRHEPGRHPRLALIFAGMATLSVIATISLLVAAVVVQ